MKTAAALLLSTLCFALPAQAAPAPDQPAPIDLNTLPELDVAVICGYSLSEGAVILYHTKKLSSDERTDAIRHFVAAAEYWHYRAGQLHATEKLVNHWADALTANHGITGAQYKYCGATAARRAEALPDAEQQTIRTAAVQAMLSIVATYGGR